MALSANRLKYSLFLSARLARRSVRRSRQSLRYGGANLSRSPILFANSFPKSGTHLLTQVLKGFTQIGPAVDSGLPAVVTFKGDTGRQRSDVEIVSDLNRLLPGDVAYGHVHASSPTLKILIQDNFASYFIYRDPRDVVVSHVYYVTEMQANHIHHQFFKHHLLGFDERLCATIAGVPIEKLQIATGKSIIEPLPSIRERYEPYLDWLNQPQVLSIRYEDLNTQRLHMIGRILDHAVERGFRTAQERQSAVSFIDHSIDPNRSPTFRSGKIGAWNSVFTQKHRKLFKDICGDLLISMGYEEDNNW